MCGVEGFNRDSERKRLVLSRTPKNIEPPIPIHKTLGPIPCSFYTIFTPGQLFSTLLYGLRLRSKGKNAVMVVIVIIKRWCDDRSVAFIVTLKCQSKPKDIPWCGSKHGFLPIYDAGNFGLLFLKTFTIPTSYLNSLPRKWSSGKGGVMYHVKVI